MPSRSHFTRKLTSAQEDAAACAVLAVLAVVVFWPQVAGGRVLYWGDIGLYFLPMASFLHDELARGHVPLWNPYLLCGTPYVGNPQTSPLYPFTLLLPATSAAQFINLSVAFHAALAACGTFLFLRRGQNRTLWAALLGAATFGFGGQFVSKEQFPNMLAAMAYLPFAVLCVQRLARNLSITNAIGLGVVLGLQLLAAHAQVSLLTLYLSAAWWIKCRGLRRRGLGSLCLALTVAAGLSAAQVFPTAAMVQDAWRQKLSFAVVDRFYLPPNQLLNWVLPFLHGTPIEGNFVGRGNFWECCCYVGVVPFALAVWGAWRARETRFWAGAFVLGVWLATGSAGGLYYLAYWVLPGVRAFHDPARCLLIASFALSVLAAAGADLLLFRVKANKPVWAAALLFINFAPLAHFDHTLYPTLPPSELAGRGPILRTVLSDPDVQGGQARTLSPDTARVWQRWTEHRSYRADAPNYWPLWTDTLTPNLPMRNGVREAFGYEPVARRDAQIVTVGVANDVRQERTAAAQSAGTLSVKYAALMRARPPKIAGWRVVRSERTLPPLDTTPDTDRVYLLLNTQWQSRARVAGGTAQIVSDTPDAVAVQTNCVRPSQLTLADTLAPGWTARVDGKRVPLVQTHGLLRTVALPVAGRHSVTFSYRPTPFLVGLYVSLLTVLGVTAWGASKLMLKLTQHGKELPPVVSNLVH